LLYKLEKRYGVKYDPTKWQDTVAELAAALKLLFSMFKLRAAAGFPKISFRHDPSITFVKSEDNNNQQIKNVIINIKKSHLLRVSIDRSEVFSCKDENGNQFVVKCRSIDSKKDLEFESSILKLLNEKNVQIFQN